MTIPYQHLLVTGGAGFVGSNLALWFRARHGLKVTCLDNLKRRGSELNLPRLRAAGVEFAHGDIRNPEDLRLDGRGIDLVIECSAEASVLAGYGDGPDYLVNTNLLGTLNCLELARRARADLVFLSSSRVYPIGGLNAIRTLEAETRFNLAAEQDQPGVSAAGIAEDFPLSGPRSLYGATKLAAELLVQEYGDMYGLRAVVNRCGVLTGPWQMGKVDQGVFALWMGRHYFGGRLSYVGWGGRGKQVRDLLHVADLAELLEAQLADLGRHAGQTYNAGGGLAGSLSLLETTQLCQAITGRSVPIASEPDNRPADIRLYITDNARVTAATGWAPRRGPRQTLQEIYEWIRSAEAELAHLWKE